MRSPSPLCRRFPAGDGLVLRSMSRYSPKRISLVVPLLPPAAAVTIFINGRPLATYTKAYVTLGRLFAPLGPLLRAIGDRYWLEGTTLTIESNDHRVRVPLSSSAPQPFDGVYVAAGAVLRGLGDFVYYDQHLHRLDVRTSPQAAIASPTPFDPAIPSAPPKEVFTPTPVETSPPVWTGPPLPRRTPLPMSSDAAKMHKPNDAPYGICSAAARSAASRLSSALVTSSR
jgi:hypothetical protein